MLSAAILLHQISEITLNKQYGTVGNLVQCCYLSSLKEVYIGGIVMKS